MSDNKGGQKVEGKDQETSKEDGEVVEGGFSKEELATQVIGELMETLEKSELGTPDEEMVRTVEKVLTALPEGKVKEKIESLKGLIKTSGEVVTSITQAQDWVWTRLKRALVPLVPDVRLKAVLLLIPDNVNEKTIAAAVRVAGVVDEKVIKTIRGIKEGGGSDEEIAQAILEAGGEVESSKVVEG